MGVDPEVSKERIAESFGKAAFQYDESAALQRNVGERLWSKMEQFGGSKLSSANFTLLDLGSGSGYFSQNLGQKTQGELISLDIAQGMLQQARQRCDTQSKLFFVNADAEKIPLKNSSVDVVFSNFVLQWCDNLSKALKECLRILKPGGCLGLSIPITGTLKELQNSWLKIDNNAHVNSFYSEEEIKSILFSVLDKSNIDSASVEMHISSYHCANYYNTLKEVLKDLKHIGANTVKGGRAGGLMGKARFAQLEDNYEQFRNTQGLPASYEVLDVIVKIPCGKSEENLVMQSE